MEFIYEDRDAVEVLNAMIDITRIYDISMNYSESVVGFIIIIIKVLYIDYSIILSIFFLLTNLKKITISSV